MADLERIRRAQIDAGEHAVVDVLKDKLGADTLAALFETPYVIVYHACGVCPSGFMIDRGPMDDVHIGKLVAPALRAGYRIAYHTRKGPCHVKMKCDCTAPSERG